MGRRTELPREPELPGLGPSNLAWMFTHFHLGHYQPLSWVTLGLDYAIWGMNPLGLSPHQHRASRRVGRACSDGSRPGSTAQARNWAGRAVVPATAGVPRRARRTLRGASPRSGRPCSIWFGALVALAWSLHPLRVEAVSWVTQRREVLCGLLTLLTLASHVRGRSRAVTAALALAAMLAKVTAVTIPVLLVLMDVWRSQGAGSRAGPGAIGRSRPAGTPLRC